MGQSSACDAGCEKRCAAGQLPPQTCAAALGLWLKRFKKTATVLSSKCPIQPEIARCNVNQSLLWHQRSIVKSLYERMRFQNLGFHSSSYSSAVSRSAMAQGLQTEFLRFENQELQVCARASAWTRRLLSVRAGFRVWRCKSEINEHGLYLSRALSLAPLRKSLHMLRAEPAFLVFLQGTTPKVIA